MSDAIADLETLLSVEEIDTGLYRGACGEGGPDRVYGGQVVAQALAAAARSVTPDRQGHSLHAYFLRAGDASRPIIYRVLRDFDGGSFANRRVVAMQGGQPILNLAASFHRSETGFVHSTPMPDIPGPEACLPLDQALAAAGQKARLPIMDRLAAFHIRPGPPVPASAVTPRQFTWFRLAATMNANDAMKRIVLAYASDFGLVLTAALPHCAQVFTPRLQVASLDHAIWFHSTPPVDEWLLYAMDSPWAGHARGFARGAVYDGRGTLVASIVQEGLFRMTDTTP